MSSPEDSPNEEKVTHVPYWQLAREGIKLLINNKQDEAEALFKLYPQSIQMNAGYAYTIFTDALMSFEDDKIVVALQNLKELEKKCMPCTGWMRSMRSKMFGTDTNTYAEQLESQIILADSHIFIATLTFLQQDISSYFKGGWLLRKSYKHYQNAYNEILNLYKEIVGDNNIPEQVAVKKTNPVSCKPKDMSNSNFNNPGVNSKNVEVKTAPTTEEPPVQIIHSNEAITETNAQVINLAILERNTEIDRTLAMNIGEKEPTNDTEAEKIAEINDAIVLEVKPEATVEGKAELPDMKQNGEDFGTNNFDANKRNEDDSDVETNSDNSGREKNSAATSSLFQNGYIPSKSYKPTFPKHSISCHASLNSCTSNSKDCNIKNGLLCESQNEFRNSKTGSKIHTCDTITQNATVANQSFLKKSKSVNSALSNHTEFQRSPSFAANLSYFTSTFNIFSSKAPIKDIDKETISRLLCAVSYGYGLLQLGISLLPPSILKVTSFLGVSGNRRNGLENLMYARHGTDMRAPFATLALLWYHTIVRPFYALDGTNVQAGVEAAAKLIEETQEEYGQSALFLFFKGRVERLKSDVDAAISAYQQAIENSTQREIKMMARHEVGWCYLIKLDYTQSERTFQCLKQTSRWSRAFYSYLAVISAGAKNTFQEVESVCELRNIFHFIHSTTQLEVFLNRRYRLCPTNEKVLKETSCLFWKLLVYELLYLWNTLPSCTSMNIVMIMGDCRSALETENEPMKGLSMLIEGSCHCILRDMERGISCFRSCLEIRKDMPYQAEDAHISAFAQYELGLLLIKIEETKPEGKKLLQTASQYKDYDFEQRLSVRMNAVLKTL